MNDEPTIGNRRHDGPRQERGTGILPVAGNSPHSKQRARCPFPFFHLKPFYLTTAIDYPNGPPHLGHAYEKVLADAVARTVRLTGRRVYFLTGLDQHGQKIQKKAEEIGTTPEELVAANTALFLALWRKLNISFDGWIETTDARHKRVVQTLLQKLFDAGELYKKTQHGYYSIRQEQFVTDKDRGPDGSFGAEWGVVEEREEENWYFRLTKHIPWLREFLLAHPQTVFPQSRYTNLLKAVDDSKGLDLCISRPKSRLRWGIELPFDGNFVTFVWFDALTNYISGAGWPDGMWNDRSPRFSELWPNDCNIIGKDILVPAHGIYWLIMLHAAGFGDDAMPRFLVHGWWNVRSTGGESEKMSKSLGNVVDPNVLADAFGADGLRYYLLSDMATGQDADFSTDRLQTRYESELANGLGNLLNRTLNMTNRYCEGVVRVGDYDDELNAELRAAVERLPSGFQAPLATWHFNRALEVLWSVVDACNRYVERTEPFKLARDAANAARVASIMRHLCEALVHISVCLEPVCPAAVEKMRAQLQWERPDGFTFDDLKWGLLPDGHRIGKGQPLFPRKDET
jgi:methionyl-tRNA synthetase